VYRRAKAGGARFVTLTDHNTIDGALALVARHPADCFVSTEATAYFPEDGCKVHVLCYGITPAQFAAIQKARENIYNLRDYLRAENIACSVAHATFIQASTPPFFRSSGSRKLCTTGYPLYDPCHRPAVVRSAEVLPRVAPRRLAWRLGGAGAYPAPSALIGPACRAAAP
jgi:hypothetical protein